MIAHVLAVLLTLPLAAGLLAASLAGKCNLERGGEKVQPTWLQVTVFVQAASVMYLCYLAVS